MDKQISISLSSIQKTKSVYIEGVGEFKVRKLGAGEELDMSDKLRRLNVIIDELQAIDLSKYKEETEENKKALEKAKKRVDTLMLEVASIKRFEIDTYKKCFSDSNDGESTKLLFDSLTEEERVTLFKAIFEPVNPLAKQEEGVKPDEE